MTNPSKPIKVLQLGSPTGLYGAERWILALIKHLDPQKIESLVGVIKDEPGLEAPLCKEAEKLGFKTHQFEAFGKINFGVIKLIRQFLLQEKIDILHTHFYKTDIIGFLATRGTPCKIISTPHGWSKKMDFKLWCYEMLDRWIFPFIHAVAPLSQDLYDSLVKIPGLKKKLYLIRNGVDISEVEQSANVNGEIIQWKQHGYFILGYIGQLISRKGLDVLLRALTTFPDQRWKLFLVGDGPQRLELEQLTIRLGLVEHVYFVGFRQERLDFLRGFDVFVLPSRLEGIPRCLMEAMAAGIPIVASDIPGCNDLVQDSDTGLLFPVDNEEYLAKAIERMMKDKDLYDSVAGSAKKMVLSRYSSVRMAKEYEELFFTFAGQ